MFKIVAIRNPVHIGTNKACFFRNVSVSSAACIMRLRSLCIFSFDRHDCLAINLPPFYYYDLLVSIVSMFQRSMLEYVRFRLVILDIEASGRLFRRSLARFLW